MAQWCVLPNHYLPYYYFLKVWYHPKFSTVDPGHCESAPAQRCYCLDLAIQSLAISLHFVRSCQPLGQRNQYKNWWGYPTKQSSGVAHYLEWRPVTWDYRRSVNYDNLLSFDCSLSSVALPLALNREPVFYHFIWFITFWGYSLCLIYPFMFCLFQSRSKNSINYHQIN